MPGSKKIIIDIVPITKIPLSRNQSFSYLHDHKLEPGTLVSVPLFHRKVSGIVTGHRPDFERLGNIELKKIESVVTENFLDEKQIALAEFIARYYFSPLGIVLKSFVPKLVKARKKNNASDIKYTVSSKVKLTPEQLKVVQEITKNTLHKIHNTKYLLYGPAASGKTEVYIHSILRLREKSKDLQFLILLPELTLTPQAIERYGQYFSPDETVVLHSKIGKGQYFSAWQKIKSGEAKIIIGSRMAVFAPFKKLGLIVVDEEQDISFKQWDMNPRYDARTVAEKLAEFHNCPIVLGSATPRVEDYYRTTTGEYELLKLPKLKISDITLKIPDTTIELVDMKKERWIKNYSPISKKLQAEIAYALKNKLQTILFINRQGMSNFSICAQCKTVLRCPKCQRALIYNKDGAYHCVHCAYKTSITPACSKCKSLNFANIGLGTQKIEREIQALFPNARVARADNQSMKTPHAQEILYEKFKQGEFDILVGTQMISKGWDLPNVALVGIIDGDGLLSVPDFMTLEKAYQSIIQVAGRTSRPGAKFPGLVLIQTFHPEQKFFRTLSLNDFEKFFSREIKDRKNLRLPPFGRLIKLIFQDYISQKVDAEAARAYSLLTEIPAKDVIISEPQTAFVSNIRGRHRKQILLKIAGDTPENVRNFLQTLPAGWSIDVDPISIL